MTINKGAPFILIALVLIVLAFFLVTAHPKSETPLPTQNIEQGSFDGRNATFTIDGQAVTLVNGVSEVPVAPSSASKIVTRYFGNEAKGDLNRDEKKDTAFLITQDGGGSGLFYYAVVAYTTPEGYKTTNAFFVGDRIAPQTMYIPIGSQELQVNYAERKSGEPMTAQPSQGVTLLLKVTKDGVLEGLMK